MTRRIEAGPRNADIMFIGEFPGDDEMRLNRPFAGYSGQELEYMAKDAGIPFSRVFRTNVLHKPSWGDKFLKVSVAKERGIKRVDGVYPAEGVLLEAKNTLNRIEEINPNVVVPLGDLALWTVTRQRGISKWRGSIMESVNGYKVVPTYNPAAVTRQWGLRWLVVSDLKRANAQSAYPEIRKPDWNFTIEPPAEQVLALLEMARGKTISCDIETRGGQIACVGIGLDARTAFCIPFMCIEKIEGYYTASEEFEIMCKMRDVLTDPNTHCIFQNGFYDLQYFAKQWGYLPNVSDDIMLMFHICFPGLRKRLDMQASLICEYYCYWKDEGKEWRGKDVADEREYWLYNCQDCVYTYEIYSALNSAIDQLNQREQYNFFQRDLYSRVFRSAPLRGFRIDEKMKNRLQTELLNAIRSRNEFLEKVLGHPINIRSPKQMQQLFFEDFGIPVVKSRKTRRPSTDDESLDIIAKREPLLKPVCEVIKELRSLGVFLNTYAKAPLSEPGRMRASVNMAGTETYRFSYSKCAFGTGANPQTISKGHEEEDE